MSTAAVPIREHQKVLREFAAGLPEEFLHCRELGHVWRAFTAARFRGGFERTLMCSRCTTRRIQRLDSRGLITGSRYEHPEGYLVRGLGHLVGTDRGLLRLESLRRSLDDGTEL